VLYKNLKCTTAHFRSGFWLMDASYVRNEEEETAASNMKLIRHVRNPQQKLYMCTNCHAHKSLSKLNLDHKYEKSIKRNNFLN